MSEAPELFRTTCPRDCNDASGIMASTRAGRVVRVAGARSHPVSRGTLCEKCAVAYNGTWLSPEQPSLRPLMRKTKSAGNFVPCTRGEALSNIAERVHALVHFEPRTEKYSKCSQHD
jgi:anaerobic selenocysteine-containing dehydrogenase